MPTCYFCGSENATKLIQTNEGEQYICDDCLDDFMRQTMQTPSLATDEELSLVKALASKKDNEQTPDEVIKDMFKTIRETSPKKLKEKLDQYVIGQEDAKKTLSLAVYNHYKRCLFALAKREQGLGNVPEDDMPDVIEKSCVIMAGPSGVGKTYLIKSLAKELDIPLAICDSSTLTEAGYVGTDAENVVRDLYEAAGRDRLRTEFGIIFLDEFDKLARKSGNNNMITADPGHEGVQQSLLKIIEGGMVSFTLQNKRRHPDAPTVSIDTSNILFICGGAFDGIDKIIERRVAKPTTMVLGGSPASGNNTVDVDGLDEDTKYNKLIDNITVDDFKSYGIITEVLGRLPIICKLHQLSEDEMLRILTEPKNALVKQYSALSELVDHVKLKFDEDALREIAKTVIKNKIGARGLRSIIETHIANAMYNAPVSGEKSKAVIHITKDCIVNNSEPEITESEEEAA